MQELGYGYSVPRDDVLCQIIWEALWILGNCADTLEEMYLVLRGNLHIDPSYKQFINYAHTKIFPGVPSHTPKGIHTY